MYKEIFKWVYNLAKQPAQAWSMMVDKEKKDAEYEVETGEDLFLKNYLYPFLGMLTLAAFLSIFTHKEFVLEQALKSSIITFVSFFGGFHLTSYLMSEIGKRWLAVDKDLRIWQHFIGYASALMFTLDIVWLLLPDLFFLYIFVLYTFYIVWEGAVMYMELDDQIRMKFTTITTVLIIASPWLISRTLLLLMPGLRF